MYIASCIYYITSAYTYIYIYIYIQQLDDVGTRASFTSMSLATILKCLGNNIPMFEAPAAMVGSLLLHPGLRLHKGQVELLPPPVVAQPS